MEDSDNKSLIDILNKKQSENPDRKLGMPKEFKEALRLYTIRKVIRTNQIKIDYYSFKGKLKDIPYLKKPIISTNKIQGESASEIIIDDPLKIQCDCVCHYVPCDGLTDVDPNHQCCVCCNDCWCDCSEDKDN